MAHVISFDYGNFHTNRHKKLGTMMLRMTHGTLLHSEHVNKNRQQKLGTIMLQMAYVTPLLLKNNFGTMMLRVTPVAMEIIT